MNNYPIISIQDHFTEGPLRDYLACRAVHFELLIAGILIGGARTLSSISTLGRKCLSYELFQ